MGGKHFRKQGYSNHRGVRTPMIQRGGAAAVDTFNERAPRSAKGGKGAVLLVAVLIALTAAIGALLISARPTVAGTFAGGTTNGPERSVVAQPAGIAEPEQSDSVTDEAPRAEVEPVQPKALCSALIAGGWTQDAVQGDSAGSSDGELVPLQAIRISVEGLGHDCMEYCVGDQNGTWGEWVTAGQEAAIENLSAIRIRLKGDVSNTHNVWYSTRVADSGWLDWASNGDAAGATGRNMVALAYRVAILPKNEAAPGTVDAPFLEGPQSISGDDALDAILEEIVNNHTGTGEDALKNAYEYLSTYYYTKQNEFPEGDWTTWSVGYAKEMYANGRGNCYRYASLLCWIARYLGYDATVKSGMIPTSKGLSAHGWVEIRQDGMAYVCDADMHKFKPEFDLFMVPYDKTPFVYHYLDTTPYTNANAMAPQTEEQ